MRIEKGFNEWRLGKNPSKDDIKRYLIDDKNAIFLFSITDYKTYTIIDRYTNEIIYSSDKLFDQDKERLLNQIQRSENYVKALSGKVGDKDKLLSFKDKSYLDYARLKGDFVLYFRYDRDDWKATIEQFSRIIYISFLIAVITSLVIGYLLSKTITIPIIDMMNKAKKMAQGEFSEVLQVKANDEIGQLTKTFNYMANELNLRLTEVQKEKNKIETILHYMTDGVIAFDICGNLIHVNSVSKHILNIDNFEYNFNQFVDKLNLGIKLCDVSKLKAFETIEKHLEINDKFLKLQIVNFTSKTNFNEGIIIVIQDNTRQHKLDNMRKDFVANVSHELRTPLTSIKGYTEALLDGGLADAGISSKFLNVIDSETDRMIRLVNDLLQLTQIDDKKAKWNLSLVNINKLIEFVAYKMEISMKNKDLSCTIELEKKLKPVYVDKYKIEQVVVNILSNSVKYTPNGGKIKISTTCDDNYVKIRIEDTGIGIPKEDLPRICERFYRVDKARSRKQGGTGLGLSIAKEILEQHNGKIEIESRIDEGTIVTMYIPKYVQDKKDLAEM